MSYRDPQAISLIGRVQMDSLSMHVTAHLLSAAEIINFVGFLGLIRFGVNTSTTNKYENRVLLLVSINCQAGALQEDRETYAEKDKKE